MRFLVGLLAALVVGYVLFIGVVAGAMFQSPGTFGQVMARIPGPLLMVVPFEPLWTRARAGELSVGDQAPDFSLLTADKTRRVSLSEFRGQRPVALVFGSYT
jgi:hypothetical protein